jgi:branched-chain amino acid transport system substrate-binding protein
MPPLFRHAIGILAVMLVVTRTHADAIRFGAILALTGPSARIGTQQMRGIQFAADKANAAGGVRGNKIDRGRPGQTRPIGPRLQQAG